MMTWELEEISAARRVYFSVLRAKSLRGIKRAQANRLRQRADALDAEAISQPLADADPGDA
jgi:hypothetical protein